MSRSSLDRKFKIGSSKCCNVEHIQLYLISHAKYMAKQPRLYFLSFFIEITLTFFSEKSLYL